MPSSGSRQPARRSPRAPAAAPTRARPAPFRRVQVSIGRRNNVRGALQTARNRQTILGAKGITLENPVMRHANNESVLTRELPRSTNPSSPGAHRPRRLPVGDTVLGSPGRRFDPRPEYVARHRQKPASPSWPAADTPPQSPPYQRQAGPRPMRPPGCQRDLGEGPVRAAWWSPSSGASSMPATSRTHAQTEPGGEQGPGVRGRNGGARGGRRDSGRQ